MNKKLLTEAENELQTVRDVLRWAVSQFNAHDIYCGQGADNTWDEAVFLVLAGLNLSPHSDARVLDARLTASEKKHVLSLIDARVTQRKPAAYLLNQAWFAGLPFFVNEHVLIPRSPIAELIENHFAPWLENIAVERILDLCTGSGCIAIACAQAFPEAQVDAVDNDALALEVCRTNIARHQLEARVMAIQSDLWTALQGRRYQLIVSNPPYVGAAELASLPPEYNFEPQQALAAGADGLDIVKRILAQAADYLDEDGILVVEVGNTAETLVEQYPHVPFLWLEFARGGHGVFLLTAEQVRSYQPFFQSSIAVTEKC